MDIFTILMLVFVAVAAILAIVNNTGKRGKLLKEKRAARQLAIANGTYRSSQGEKILLLLFTAVIYGLVGFLFSAGTSWVWDGIFYGVMIGIVFGLISLLIANAAEAKGRSFIAFFMFSVLLSPIIMGIIVATIGPQSASSKTFTNPSSSIDKTGTDPAAQLKKLGSLRNEGLITAEEFEAKKKELLDRI